MVKSNNSIKYFLITLGITWIFFILGLPLVILLTEAFSGGFMSALHAILEPESIDALKLTLFVALIMMPINLIIGFLTAWLISHFDFRGKSLFLAMIDLPLAISPIVTGLLFVLLFGAQSVLAPYLIAAEINIIFAVPGIILASLFITYPYVIKSLIPLMQAQGHKEEEAAIILGASPWQLLIYIVLPKIRWGLTQGMLLSTARALGEFGAVAVVSGYIRGSTVTMPLQIEIYYNEYEFISAFACSALLAVFALLLMLIKNITERRLTF